MKEARGNILNTKCDGIFVTTNGFVKNNGECVMGRGIAKQVAMLDAKIPKLLGNNIKRYGNVVSLIKVHQDTQLWSFPVKPISSRNNGTNVVNHMRNNFNLGSSVPGWACKAEATIIQNSVDNILKLLEEGKLSTDKTYLIGRPGCGAGELDWSDIKPIMEKLPDNFICMTY